MCRISKKLLLYDYMIGRLTKWYSERNKIDESVVLKGWTSTALMKYLYITCVISTKKTNQVSLFNLFDNFVAFPHGPVEIDTYYNRGILIRYNMGYDKTTEAKFLRKCMSYRYEQMVQYDLKPEDTNLLTKTSDELLLELIDRNGLADYKNVMDLSINELLEAKSLPEFKDTSRLIAITHQILWNEAWASSSKQLRLDNDDYMRQEREAIEKAVQIV